MSDKIKTIEIEGRKFQIHKMSPKTSIKVVKMLGAKILPFLDSLPIAKISEYMIENSIDEFLQDLNLYSIANALDSIDDQTIDKLIDYSLAHCYEPLPAGSAQVLNPNGTYGVTGVEDDLFLIIRLSMEAISWSVSSFFQGDRWTSMFQNMGTLFPLNVPTLTK